MFINLIISFFICLPMCLFSDCKGNTNQRNWLKGLANYVKEDTSAYQTLLIIINEDLFQKEEQVETILRQIKSIKPSIHIIVRNKTIEKDINNLKRLIPYGSSATTFFMIIDSVQNNFNIATEIIKLISILLKGNFRPKCLVLEFSDAQRSLNPMKKEFLRNAWNNQFLHVSILEIVGKTSNVQYFNPFTKMYSTKTYSSGTALFPDKLRNMNRYQLEVSVLHFPPNVYIEYNSSGYPVNYYGSDVLLINAFAKKMNFIVKFEAGVNITTKIPFFFRQLILNKMQISLVRTTLVKVGEYSYMEHLVTGIGSFNALTPKMQNQVHFDELSFVHALAPIAAFSAMLWLLMYALKHYSNYWNLSFTMQVVLGLTVSQEPLNWKARVIYAYMIIVSFVYSSKIYAMLTSTNLQPVPELQLMTLAELNNSGLGLEINPVLHDFMSKDVQNLKIVKNSHSLLPSTEDCALHLITERNVSCVMLRTQSNWFASRFKGGDGRALSATVDEPFIISAEGFYMERGSPYVRRFRRLLLQLRAFGIFGKWNKDVVPSMSPTEKNKEKLDDLAISYNQLFPILVTEFLVGFLISGIVFLVEIVLANIQRRGRV